MDGRNVDGEVEGQEEGGGMEEWEDGGMEGWSRAEGLGRGRQTARRQDERG